MNDTDVPNWLIDTLVDFDFWGYVFLFPEALLWFLGALFYVLFWTAAQD